MQAPCTWLTWSERVRRPLFESFLLVALEGVAGLPLDLTASRASERLWQWTSSAPLWGGASSPSPSSLSQLVLVELEQAEPPE